jgi:hypothetical protein
MLWGAAELVATRAGAIELQAAKNASAGFDKGESNKLKRASDLRRIAAFLTDPRLHALIRTDERLLELLMGAPLTACICSRAGSTPQR